MKAGSRKKEEGRRKKEEGRRKWEVGSGKMEVGSQAITAEKHFEKVPLLMLIQKKWIKKTVLSLQLIANRTQSST